MSVCVRMYLQQTLLPYDDRWNAIMRNVDELRSITNSDNTTHTHTEPNIVRDRIIAAEEKKSLKTKFQINGHAQSNNDKRTQCKRQRRQNTRIQTYKTHLNGGATKALFSSVFFVHLCMKKKATNCFDLRIFSSFYF